MFSYLPVAGFGFVFGLLAAKPLATSFLKGGLLFSITWVAHRALKEHLESLAAKRGWRAPQRVMVTILTATTLQAALAIGAVALGILTGGAAIGLTVVVCVSSTFSACGREWRNFLQRKVRQEVLSPFAAATIEALGKAALITALAVGALAIGFFSVEAAVAMIAIYTFFSCIEIAYPFINAKLEEWKQQFEEIG